MRRRLLFLCLAALLAACSTSAGAGATSGPTRVVASSAPAQAARPTATPEPPASAVVRQTLTLADSPWIYGIATAGDTVWVEGKDHIVQLDGATGAELRRLDGSWPTVIGDSLWYVRNGELVEARATDGKAVAVHSPPGRGTRVVDGVAWTASEETGTLTGFDLAKKRVVHEVALPAGEPKWIEAWEGSLWVVIDGSGGVVVRVDPETGEIVRDDIDAGYRPHSVVVAFGSLWVTDHGKAQLFRIGPDGGEQAKIQGPGLNVAITASEKSIWAAGPESLFEIDPTTNGIIGRTPIDFDELYGLAYSSGFLWMTSGEAGKLLQIEPLH